MSSKYADVPARVIDNLFRRTETTDSGCWLFTGAPRADGYAQVGWATSDGKYVQGRAHRVAWMHFYGPLADSTPLDHICHDPTACRGGDSCPHRRCVNPQHLKPVTSAENASRRVSSGPRAMHLTHCPAGHAFDEANTYVRPSGLKQCRTCDRIAKRIKYAKRKARRA